MNKYFFITFVFFTIKIFSADFKELFNLDNNQINVSAVIDLSYKDYKKNPYLSENLDKIFTILSDKEYIKQNYDENTIIFIQQALLKLKYFIGHKKINNKILKSDLYKKINYNILTPDIEFDIVYNNDEYSNSNYAKFVKGKQIKNNNIPIGYVIFLSKKQVKNIVFEIYAGNKKIDIKNRLYEPKNYLNSFEKKLLNNSTVLIKLNLCDFLKNDNYQGHIELSLLTKIHDCINYFYDIIKNKPNFIYKKLTKLKNKPIFLSGSSFGGLMSVYHAINYPKTFTGYISHAGGLYGNGKYNNFLFNNYLKLAETTKIKKIEDPIFIHHSLDDNRVKVQFALEFYRLAKLANKQKLIKLFIDNHGSAYEDEKEPDLHGHFYPEGYYLEVFLQQFIDFINSDGKNIDPLINEWRYEKFKNISYRLEKVFIEDKILLSEAIKCCKNHFIKNEEDYNQLWLDEIAPYLWEVHNNILIDDESHISYLLLRQKFQKILNYNDKDLQDIVKILLKEDIIFDNLNADLVLTDDFVSNVLRDIKYWLNDELDTDKDSFLSKISNSFVHFIVNKNIFKILLLNEDASTKEILNNTKLKNEIFTFLMQQKQRSLHIIKKKVLEQAKK